MGSVRCLLVSGILASIANGAVQKMGEVSPYYENLLTLDRGANITSSSEPAAGFDLRTIIDPIRFPGPENGGFVFADRRQRECFTLDLGLVHTSGLVIIRTHPGDGPVHGDGDKRRPRTMTVEVSADAHPDKYVTLVAWTEPGGVPRKQSVAWDGQPVRYLRIDLGDNDDAIGSRLADVSLFRRYRLPPMAERLRDVDQLLRRDVPELAAYRKARAAGDDVAAVLALRSHFGQTQVDILRASEKHRKYVEDWKSNTVRFDERSWRIPGKRFDWHVIPCDLSDEPPSYWIAGLQFWYLPDYYNDHRDPGLARDAARMIRDWMGEVPCPGLHKVPGRAGLFMVEGWPAIRVANRTGALARALVQFASSRNEFDDDTWVQVLYAVWEHAAFLAQVSPELGGNWLTWANERLILTARDFPEFADQKHWLEVGRNTYETVVRRDMTDSGKECEDSTFYCLRALNEIVHSYSVFEKAGVSLPADVESRVQKSLDFPAWVHQPGFRNPGIGDIGTVGQLKPNLPLVHEYAAAWKRTDLVYIDTVGKEGTRPQQTSRAFLPDGWFILRSDWTDELDARHLIFRAPPSNCRGHGHLDVLAVVLYAYGRPLLIDPGMTLYGVKGSEQYVETSMHNAVIVDGKSQRHGPGKVNSWESTPAFDLADAEHELFEGVVHRRRVLFVRADYYVLIDDLEGTGRHQIELDFHFLTGANPIDSSGMVRTRFSSGANLALIPIGPTPLASEAKEFKYVTAEREGGMEVPSVGWRFGVDAQLPQRLVTILFPYPGQQPPEGLSGTAVGANAIEVRSAGRVQRIAWRPDGAGQTWITPWPGTQVEANAGAVVVCEDVRPAKEGR